MCAGVTEDSTRGGPLERQFWQLGIGVRTSAQEGMQESILGDSQYVNLRFQGMANLKKKKKKVVTCFINIKDSSGQYLLALCAQDPLDTPEVTFRPVHYTWLCSVENTKQEC